MSQIEEIRARWMKLDAETYHVDDLDLYNAVLAKFGAECCVDYIPFLLRMVEAMAAAMKGEYIGGKRYESIKDIIEHFEKEVAK